MEINSAGHLTYNQLARAAKSMTGGKAPGIDAITAEVLGVGGRHTVSVILPLYKAVPGLEWFRKFGTR